MISSSSKSAGQFVIEDPYATEVIEESNLNSKSKSSRSDIAVVYPKHPPLAIRYQYISQIVPELTDFQSQSQPISISQQQGNSNSNTNTTPGHLVESESHAHEPGQDIEVAFSDMVVNQPSEESHITVVLDCANIGWSYGHDVFLAEGISKAIEYFESVHVKSVGFLPLSYVRKKPYAHAHGSHYYSNNPNNPNNSNSKGRKAKGHYDTNAHMETDDWSLLEELASDNKISLVPSGDYDDSYILSYARENNAYVVSNDMFMDHLSHVENPSVRKSMSLWLRVNRCSYSFVQGKFMLNPKWYVLSLNCTLICM